MLGLDVCNGVFKLSHTHIYAKKELGKIFEGWKNIPVA
jgi:hypothetical protein